MDVWWLNFDANETKACGMIVQTSVIVCWRAMQTCELGLTDTVNGIFKVYIIVINVQWCFIEALSAEEVAAIHWISHLLKNNMLKRLYFQSNRRVLGLQIYSSHKNAWFLKLHLILVWKCTTHFPAIVVPVYTPTQESNVLYLKNKYFSTHLLWNFKCKN